jgi:hypothetical protein
LEDDDRAKYLFLALLQARVGSSLVSHLGNLAPEAVLRTNVAELAGRAKISDRASRAFEELQRVFDPGLMQDRLAAKGIEALTPVDEAYPGLLRSIPDPPPAVFVNGKIPVTASVALVGSRKASATGIETARALGFALSERGFCVVSGLALGVDAAAHEGAVDAGGPTVGVLGCGIDVTYPTKYKRLRVALPRQAARGPHAALRTDHGLGIRLSSPRAHSKALRRQRRAPGSDPGQVGPNEDTSLPHVSVPPNLRGAWGSPMAVAVAWFWTDTSAAQSSASELPLYAVLGSSGYSRPPVLSLDGPPTQGSGHA